MGVTFQRAIEDAALTLKENGIKESRLEAGLLLSDVINRDRIFIIAHPKHDLAPDQLERFQGAVAQRAVGAPLQYITGHQEFFALDFEVTPDVLIPRPETEAIVEIALELLQKNRRMRLADVGTGSGCLAISILRELPNAHCVAMDISSAALAVAQRNADRHGVLQRMQFLESDLMSKVNADETFDLIVSNPPYVPDDEIDSLQREVKFEPRSALAGGPDGLSIIRSLLNEAAPHLGERGHLVFEFGFGQSELLLGLIDQQTWEVSEMRSDLQGIPRTMVLEKKAATN